ncbi:MAG TPA: ATP-binding cassette domain-containing protein, partial [Thiotrichales bacterium]|nr:ATP-binding cassette domain-containing protein [Thiotrichales bacterium]
PPIRAITSIISELQRGIAAAESVFGFLDLENEKDNGRYETGSVRGDIDFKQLSFRYSSEKDDALHDLNISIKAGQTVAFVGRSGSGKSTLLNLIPRLYEVSEGDICLDGRSIKDYTLANLRSHISYVGQDVVLFNDTIEHNIAYGQMKDATHEQVIAAAEAAYALDFIKQSSDGFNTIVGERGVMLSGGQRQRIAIARALLKNAPVLILDEATSALDTESERYIQASLENLMKNRTTLVIAHRLSTIENADVIMVMDHGRIVESGSHAELLALNAHYAALHRIQFKDD